MRPGQPIITCGCFLSCKLRISSSVDVPPTRSCVFNPFIIPPIPSITDLICVDNSLVGEIHNACVLFIFKSMASNMPIVKHPVLPVPDCACAIMSFLFFIGKIALCCIGLGFSNPYE